MNYTDQQILDMFFPIDEEYGLSQKWEDIMKGLKPKSLSKNNIHWRKNGKTYFKQYPRTKMLWCDTNLVWGALSNKNKLNYRKTKELIKSLMLLHDEWKDYKPY